MIIGINQIKLVSFKNIHIWAYVFGHSSAFFGPIGLTIIIITQETIIYRLVVSNPSYDAYFSVLIFWATSKFNGKIGVATKHAPYGLEPPRPKIWLNVWTFWVNRYLEFMFSKFSGLNPFPLKAHQR